MQTRFIKLIIESEMILVSLLSKAVRAICNTVTQDEIVLYNLELCIVEAVMNVIQHAYHRKPGNVIEIIVTLDLQDITFHIIDTGDITSFPPAKEMLFDNPKDIAKLPESGMGLYIIQHVMDEVTFRRIEEKNILMLKKHTKKATNN